MLDLSYFQNSGNVNTQTFTNAGSWVTWIKPRDAKFVNVLCIGSGGGGGGGFQAAAGNKSGGSGGGGGGIVRAQFQASILPDILYVYTGVGGTGGTGGSLSTSGNAGEKSFVCLIPDTSSVANIVVTSGNVSARGGISGSTVQTANPSGETIATAANAVFLNLGTFLAVAGTVGAAGVLGIATSNTAITQICMGGSAGGGTGAGGGFTSSGPFPGNTPAAVNTSGVNGIILYKPILGFQGAGGGGGLTNGGKGGESPYGCGGGGGGAGTTSAGNGGRGGDGLIIITTSF